MGLSGALLVVTQLAVTLLVLGIGLASTVDDLTYLWRRPALLGRSLFAMYVAVPAVILAMAKGVPMSPPVRTAVTVLAISAGAPLLPRRLMNLGRRGYVLSLVATSALVAIVAVPAWVQILAAALGRDTSLSAVALARVIARAFLGPMLVGIALRRALPSLADRLARAIAMVAGVALVAGAAGLLAIHGHLLVDLGVEPAIALLAMTGIALAIGHALGGPDPRDRTALAVSCAMRHVGIAMLAAAVVPNPRVVACVLAYLLSAAIISGGYLTWRAAAARDVTLGAVDDGPAHGRSD